MKASHFAVVRVDAGAPGKVIVPCLERRQARIYVKSFNSGGRVRGPRVGLCPVRLTLLRGDLRGQGQ